MGALSWLVGVTQFALAAVLVAAATGKLLRPDEFRGALRATPHMPVRSLSVLIPLLELGLGVVLGTARGGALTFAFGAAGAAFLVFTGWAAWVLASGLRLTCGCFGSHSAEVTLKTVVRNAALVGLAGAGVLASQFGDSPSARLFVWRLGFVSSLALALVLLLALREVLPYLALSHENFEDVVDQTVTLRRGE